MRIGIDVRMLEAKTGLTGIATSLLETLRQLNEIDNRNEYFLFSRKPITCDIDFNLNWHLINKDFPQGMIWYNTILVSMLISYKIDVFWNLNHILPIYKPSSCKYVVTINDLAIFKIPQIGEKSNTVKQHLFVKYSCKLADKVIAISEATKRDLIDILHISDRKIAVNYLAGLNTNAVSSNLHIEDVKRKYKINGSYYLYIGTLEPRKNLMTLVKAYNELCLSNGLDNVPKLVIAGGKGWRFEETQQVINQVVSSSNILQIGYISSEEKRLLLEYCTAFVFPSLYEGFGIPVIEAMSFGALVITSLSSSLSEVGGNAAIYIENPTSINSLKEKLDFVLHISEDERMDMSNKSLEQSNKFTWEATARGAITVFSELNS